MAMIPLLCKREREGVGMKDRAGGGSHNGRWGQVKEGGDGQRKEEEKQGDDDGNWWCHSVTELQGRSGASSTDSVLVPLAPQLELSVLPGHSADAFSLLEGWSL